MDVPLTLFAQRFKIVWENDSSQPYFRMLKEFEAKKTLPKRQG